jgi:predicted alpha/beta-hydrolase family hydrolase
MKRQVRSERDEVGTANPVSVSMLSERISGVDFDAATKSLQQAKPYVSKRILSFITSHGELPLSLGAAAPAKGPDCHESANWPT